MDSLLKFVVMICLYYNSTQQLQFFGTGFLVEYKNSIYVVSCKHVFNIVKGREILAAAELKKTNNPSKPFIRIELGKPYYHSTDNKDSTYDLIVYKTKNLSKKSLKSRGIAPLVINPTTNISSKDIVYSCGFPTDYFKESISLNKDEYLSPKTVQGNLRNYPLDTLSQIGFEAPLSEWYFIQSTNNEKLGKGCSGGLSFILEQSGKICPVGVIVGEGDITYYPNQGKSEKYSGIICVPIKGVYEILLTIE